MGYKKKYFLPQYLFQRTPEVEHSVGYTLNLFECRRFIQQIFMYYGEY